MYHSAQCCRRRPTSSTGRGLNRWKAEGYKKPGEKTADFAGKNASKKVSGGGACNPMANTSKPLRRLARRVSPVFGFSVVRLHHCVERNRLFGNIATNRTMSGGLLVSLVTSTLCGLLRACAECYVRVFASISEHLFAGDFGRVNRVLTGKAHLLQRIMGARPRFPLARPLGGCMTVPYVCSEIGGRIR